jgi:hypothetical protein
MTINVLFVYGAGNDTMFGGGLRQMQSLVINKFKDKIYLRQMQSLVINKFKDKIYSPRIIDYTEYATLVRLLQKWQDPTILVGHSCGCMSITRAAIELSMERIPYLMAIAPSIFCPVSALAVNVGRATQVTSNMFDIFNPGARQLLSLNKSNNKTKLDVMYSGLPHIQAPYYVPAQNRLLAECERALG